MGILFAFMFSIRYNKTIYFIKWRESMNTYVYMQIKELADKYAGAFLEEAAVLCIKHKYEYASKVKIQNTLGIRPKTFEIDCLVDNLAHEIKWRDATTDGDHITKEHTRVQAISKKGYIPVRVMFYYPQRTQAQKIQDTLKTLYQGIGGKYYYGDAAWRYIEEFTGIDLLGILECIAQSRE